ncbi:non-specific lipid-transfer protein 1-like [Durio zibethinus]|uniref:Non-specific lipid-transfer protein n=1 Tax=Durio zibethinus TaxID=66656 RepID=A0A6P6A865_DURZI|nr:non-specific lipid-transfer protein 1-like [Durio zibethinus]
MAAALKLVCALLLCMLVVEPMATTAISCGYVAKQISGCIKYLQNGGFLPPNCCMGIRALNNGAKTTRDRRSVCRCLQNAARTIPGIKRNLAVGLPKKCGVKIPYKISPSTNCNRVK